MTDELTGANNQLALFGKTFGQIKADWQKGYGLKSLSNVISADDMQQLKNYSKWLMDGTKSTEDFKDAMSYCSTSTQKLGNEILKLKTKVDNEEMTVEDATAEMNRMITAEETATGTTNALRSAFGKLALNLAISFAISGLITLFTEIAQAEQKAIDKANELADTYKNQQGTLSQLKEEYLDIVDSTKSEAEKTKELYELKKKLIRAYGYEKSAIEGVTTARATGLKFFDEEEYKNAKEYVGINGDKYREILGKFNSTQISGNGLIPDFNSLFSYSKPVLKNIDNIEKEVNEYLKDYGIIFNDLTAVDEYAYSLSLNYGNNIYEAIENINNVLSDLDEKELHNIPLTSFEKQLKPALKSVLEGFKKQVKDSENILSETGEAYFTKYFHEFLNIDANKLDNVTADTFDSWVEKFNKYIEEHAKELAGDENFKKISEEYFKGLKIDLFPEEVIAQTNKYGYSLTSLSEKLEIFSDITKDVSTKQSTIQSALEKVRAGTSLTSDEMQKLGDAYPDLLGKFEETVDGWTIGADELIDANDKITQSVKDAVDEQKKSLNETIDKIKAQLAETPTIGGQSDYEEWQKKQAQLNKDLEDAQNQLQGLDNLVKSFGSDLSGLNDKLKEYNDSLKYCETLNKRLSNLNQGKTLLTQWADTTDWKSDFSSIVDAIVEAFPQNAKIKEAANKWFVEQTEEAARGLVTEYETAYNEDLDNFNTYLKAKFNYADKYSEDGTSWQSFLSANTEFVDEFKSAYDIDLTNYKNWIDARADLQKKLLELDDELFDPLTQSAERERLWKEFTDGVEARFNAYLGGINNPKYNPYPDSSGSKGGSTNDPIKDAFNDDMKEIEHLHNMGLKSDKEYYDALETANEKHYKNSAEHESDYLSNVEKIYKARQELYADDADKQFDDLEDQYKKGIISAEQYAKAVSDLGQELYGEDSLYGGTEFAKKKLEELDKTVKEVSDDIYSEFKEGLGADGDRLLEDVLADADKLSKKNIELFSDDPKTLKENAENILDAVSKSAQDALERGLISSKKFKEIIDKYSVGISSGLIQDIYDDAFETIVDKAKDNLDTLNSTPEEYFKLLDEWGKKLGIADDVIQKYKDAVSESDFLDRWDLDHGYDSSDSTKDYKLRADRVKYIYDLAEQLYGKDGQKNVKAYNALIKQGLEEEKSIWEDRVNDEKSFWEDRQEELENYYDTRIDKLKEVEDEEKKVKDLEEKQLALIKARQNLENAKKQRNQLIFEGGTFRYDVDQDAVLSAEEELADAIEALRDEELNTQIELLEQQKNNAVEFYKKIIDKIDEYLNKDSKVLSSDSEVLNTILETDTTPKTNFDMQKFIEGGSNFESLVKALGGAFTQKAADYFKDSYNATLVGKQITPSTVDKVVNNSNSTTNNSSKSVVIEKLEVNLQLTVESLEDFVQNKIEDAVDKMGKAIQQRIPAILAKA